MHLRLRGLSKSQDLVLFQCFYDKQHSNRCILWKRFLFNTIPGYDVSQQGSSKKQLFTSYPVPSIEQQINVFIVLICLSCISTVTQFRIIQTSGQCYPYWVGPYCIKLTTPSITVKIQKSKGVGNKEAKISQSKCGCILTTFSSAQPWSRSPDYRNLIQVWLLQRTPASHFQPYTSQTCQGSL